VKLGIFYLLIGIPFAELLVGFVCCVSEDEEFSLNAFYLLPPTPLYQGGVNLKITPYQGGEIFQVLCVSIPLFDKKGLGAVEPNKLRSKIQ